VPVRSSMKAIMSVSASDAGTEKGARRSKPLACYGRAHSRRNLQLGKMSNGSLPDPQRDFTVRGWLLKVVHN
jgi:hypothetical protein